MSKEGTESPLGRAYRGLYEALCGQAPTVWPWHCQWVSARLLNRDMARWLPNLRGDVLDIGCGRKPYRNMAAAARTYVGVDVSSSAAADVLADACAGLPFGDRTFDGILMSQVLQYTADPSAAVAEVRRVLRPGGMALITYPFIYNEHAESDFGRWTARAVPRLFHGFAVRHLQRQGGIGSALAILFLDWIDVALNRNYMLRMSRPLLLPFWLPLCLAVNVLAILLDAIDRTGKFYINVLVVLDRAADGHPADGATASRVFAPGSVSVGGGTER